MKHLLVTKTTLVVSTPHLFLAFCLGLEEVQGRRSVHTWSLFFQLSHSQGTDLCRGPMLSSGNDD